ncbi:extended synaptotagmin-3 [Daktulosphaira vitifoliae]|uniref:extended synaptotagmin-3 n=1 Tax=Daktulosphaira vitifoliae TaxID=58002 RepID=UPI0021AA0C97|nr:extended synaptotagmin-3 [Daktulosphaira vitifoliae]
MADNVESYEKLFPEDEKVTKTIKKNVDELKTVKENQEMENSSLFSTISHAALSFASTAFVYAIGYWRVAAVSTWVLIPIMTCVSIVRDRWREVGHRRRRRAQMIASADEKKLITASVAELPSWVFFPDMHRAEWLNQMIKQMWPLVSAFTQTTIKQTVEPMVAENLREYNVNSFAFDKLRLGSIPPKIGGIKVYEGISRDQIMMDVDLIFSSDCDVSFVVKGVTCGIKDFQLRGIMRVIMKPLIATAPLIGGMHFFFLHQPDIDYDLVGVADVLDMPGLNDVLRKVIAQQVSALMVLPNKIPIVLSNDVPTHHVKLPEPEGVLRVHIVQAKNLVAKDMSLMGRKGKSDPYVIITLGAKEYRTPTIKNDLNPKWDYWCEFVSFSPRGQLLKLKLFDEDEIVGKKHSNLGKISFEVYGAVHLGEVDKWVNLEDTKHGMVHVRLQWLELTSDKSALKRALSETQELRVTNMSSAILTLYIDSAINLPNARSQSKPDPYVKISIGQESQITVSKLRTERPVFEQGFTFLVSNPETDTIEFKVIDQKTGVQLGIYEYKLTRLFVFGSMEQEMQPFDLITDSKHKHHDCKLVFCAQLKFLHRKPKVFSNEDAITKPLLLKQSSTISTKSNNSNNSSGSTENLPTVTNPSIDEPSISRPSSIIEDDLEVPPIVIEQDQELEIKETHASSDISGLNDSSHCPLGSIQLSFDYSVVRQRLNVTVHKVVNLPIKEPSNIPDPYVKLYILPKKDNANSKRKTEAYKDQCNPVFEETFEYVLGIAELNSKQLEVTVLTKKTWHSPVLGQIILNLSDYVNQNSINFTGWFDLQPEAKEVA